MTLETDLLLDRRRLKRELVLWRVLAVLALVGALGLASRREVNGLQGGPHLARLTVSGIITENTKLVDKVEALAKDPQVRALIVRIDSPGGSVPGGESLHDAIADVAAKKPVVAVMDGVAASAGYMIAVPAARIFAQNSTLTGSIGVLLPTGEVSGLMKIIGVSSEDIVSGPLKDQPSYTHPLSPEGRAVLQGIVMDMYDQFVDMVAAGRHMDADKVRALADGRAYTGRQALKLGLIDQIGGEPQARAWLAKAKSIPETLSVQDVEVKESWRERLFSSSLPGLFLGLWKSVVSQGLMLDEPQAIWQPSRD